MSEINVSLPSALPPSADQKEALTIWLAAIRRAIEELAREVDRLEKQMEVSK